MPFGQCSGSGSAWIRMNPHHFGSLDPHPHEKKSESASKLKAGPEPDPAWFNLQMPNQNDGLWAYFSIFSRVWALIWKLGSGSGSASGWKVGSGSASNKNLNPDPNQGDNSNPDPHQSDADPQHCFQKCSRNQILMVFERYERCLMLITL